MRIARAILTLQICLLSWLALGNRVQAQTGNSGTIQGTVNDPSGAVVSKASVNIHNPVSGFTLTTTTDNSGNFTLANVPYNPYHLTVTATGFANFTQDVEIRSAVALNLTQRRTRTWTGPCSINFLWKVHHRR
jgi:hypothetical protein